jgi:3-dehydroquinate dehydratase
MKNKNQNKPILVIHGPNMTLISHRSIAIKKRLTLDKVNKCLRKEAGAAGYRLRVIQTNNEAEATVNIQRLRNKISGIIIFPGPWQKSAHIIKDVLEILQIPFITISTGEKADLLRGISNIQNKDLLMGCQIAIERLIKSGKP